MKLKDKVAIVTGAGRGIGEGIARTFAREGARIIVAERNEADGRKIAAELDAAGAEARFVQTDVSQRDSVLQMMEEAIANFGRIDILVNNAGIHLSKTIEDTSEEEWDRIQRINLRGPFLCSKYSIPHLRRTRGNIVNIASVVGLIGQSKAAAYAATRGGIIAMSKSMAIDLAPDRIRVNILCPGVIATPLGDEWYSQQPDPQAARDYLRSRHPLGRVGTIEDCGHAALFLASAESEFLTGVVLNVDGGIALGY